MTDQEIPKKCCVVIKKEGQFSIPCPDAASVVINITDPDDPVRVMAVLVLCERHAAKFSDEGRTLLIQDPEGNLELAQSLNSASPGGTIEEHDKAS